MFCYCHKTRVELCGQCSSNLYFDRINVAIVGESSTRGSRYHSLLWWDVHKSFDQGLAGIFSIQQPFYINLCLLAVIWFALKSFAAHDFKLHVDKLTYCSLVKPNLMEHYNMLGTREFRSVMQ